MSVWRCCVLTLAYDIAAIIIGFFCRSVFLSFVGYHGDARREWSDEVGWLVAIWMDEATTAAHNSVCDDGIFGRF